MQLRITVGIFLIATPAIAKPGVTEDDIKRPAEVEPSVAAGNLLPFTIGASHERLGILLSTYGGYDVSKDTPVMSGRLDATLLKRITLRASADNPGMSTRLSPSFGALVDVLRASDYYVDLAVGGAYDTDAWNNVPAVIAQTAIGGNIGLLRLQGDAGVGLGLEGSERYGDLRLSGLHPVGGRVYAGVDSRARVDLQSGTPTELHDRLEWDMQAGPVATLAMGRFAFSATGGVSAWRTRTGESAHVGAMGALGVGAAF